MARQGQASILTKKEQKTVLNSFIGTKHEHRNRAIFLLSFRAGLRAKEIASVSVSHFVPTYIYNELSRKPKYENDDLFETVVLRREVTKGSKIEKALIQDKELRQALLDYVNIRQSHFYIRTYKAEYPTWRVKDEKPPIVYKDTSLFITNKGVGFSPNGMSHLFLALSKKSGVRFTSHSGRRTLCTQLVQKGINMFDVQAILRHESISTTMLYYQKDESRLGNIMAKLNL